MYKRVWRIELHEHERAGRRANGMRRFRVDISGDRDSTGYGHTAQEAYRNAEAELVVKPGFVEVSDD